MGGGREKEARKGIGKRGKEKGKRKKGGWLTRYDDKAKKTEKGKSDVCVYIWRIPCALG